MQTRSGSTYIQKRTKKTKTSKQENKRQFLLKSFLRPNGDADTIHECPICLKSMRIVDVPSWTQCPKCHDVTHTACFRKHCSTRLEMGEKPECVSCKHHATYMEEEDDTAGEVHIWEILSDHLQTCLSKDSDSSEDDDYESDGEEKEKGGGQEMSSEDDDDYESDGEEKEQEMEDDDDEYHDEY